jgi:hypothetical protein
MLSTDHTHICLLDAVTARHTPFLVRVAPVPPVRCMLPETTLAETRTKKLFPVPVLVIACGNEVPV